MHRDLERRYGVDVSRFARDCTTHKLTHVSTGPPPYHTYLYISFAFAWEGYQSTLKGCMVQTNTTYRTPYIEISPPRWPMYILSGITHFSVKSDVHNTSIFRCRSMRAGLDAVNCTGRQHHRRLVPVVFLVILYHPILLTRS